MTDMLDAEFLTPAMPMTEAAVSSSSSDLLSLLMDELAYGVVVVDPRAYILHANQAGRAELARRRVLGEANGSLYALAVQDGKTLQAALDKVANGKRSLINLRASGSELSLVLVPLKNEDGARAGRVALFFARTAVCESLVLRFFAGNYRLTATEEQVLDMLCQGFNTPDAAKHLNVAVSTVRSHVRSLCAKTQSSGIRELVSRVAVLPPVAHTPQPECVH